MSDEVRRLSPAGRWLVGGSVIGAAVLALLALLGTRFGFYGG